MNKLVNYRFMRGIGATLMVFGVAGCASVVAPSMTPTDVVITIDFDENDCPIEPASCSVATCPTLDFTAGDKLVFQSNPPHKDFTITFSPVAGQAYRTKTNQGVPTGKIQMPAMPPNVLPDYSGQNTFAFKYSISAENCVQIDPMVIVKR